MSKQTMTISLSQELLYRINALNDKLMGGINKSRLIEDLLTSYCNKKESEIGIKMEEIIHD